MPTFTRNLWLTSPMMRGGDVAQVQRQFVKLGAKLSCDGVFGRATSDAVSDFQSRNVALDTDGILGRHTWSMLFDEPGIVVPDRTVADILTADTLMTLGKPHQYFALSERWRVGVDGVVMEGEGSAVSTDEFRKQVARVFSDYSQALANVLSKVPVPIELVLACICVESNGRATAERRERGCSAIDPALTPARVSVGLMQTLLSTARDALSRPDLSLADLKDPLISIEAGATYMWRQARATSFDPPLVACAYNAGSLRFNNSPQNRWKLVQYPIGSSAYADHFVSAFNAAMSLDAIGEMISSLGGRIQSYKAAMNNVGAGAGVGGASR